MKQTLKKLTSGVLVAALMAPAVVLPSSALDLSEIDFDNLAIDTVVHALLGDEASKAIGKAEQTIKNTLEANGIDQPETDVLTYGFVTWDGEGNRMPYDELEVAKNQSVFPKEVYFRDNNGGFNQQYEFYLYKGTLYIRNRDAKDAWRVAPINDSLKGKLKAMSVDNNALYVVDNDGWVYFNIYPNKGTEEWRWKTAVIGLIESQPSYKLLTSEPGQWVLSSTDAEFDQFYIDSEGEQRATAGAGCTTLYYVNPKDNTKIILCDPWLANDNYRQVASPVNGRFQIQAMSASSSTMFVINETGDMFTRQYDYDLSGSDELQFNYTYEDHNEDGDIHLPAESWYQQPKINGTITDRVSIESLGGGSNNRLLRVEGVKNGQTGYFEKTLKAGSWTFHATGEPLKGNLLKNTTKDTSGQNLADPTGIVYEGAFAEGSTLIVTDFNYASTEQEAYLTVGEGTDEVTAPVTLYLAPGNLGTLTSGEYLPRQEGLTEEARLYTGCLVLSDDAYGLFQTSEAGQKFLTNYMKGEKKRALAAYVNDKTFCITENGRLQHFIQLGVYKLERMDNRPMLIATDAK